MSQTKYPSLVSVLETAEHIMIPIYSNQFTIGRCTTNNYIIPVIQLSREHCKFTYDETGNWHITDLSTFGTFVNGNKLSKGVSQILHEGDLVNFGPSKNEFLYRFTHHLDHSPPMKRARMDNDQSFAAGDKLLMAKPSSSREIHAMELTLQGMAFEIKAKDEEIVAMKKVMQDKDEEHRCQLSDLEQRQEAKINELSETYRNELLQKETELRELLAKELQTMEDNIKNGIRVEENAKIKQLHDELERVKVEFQRVVDHERELVAQLRNSVANPADVKESVFEDVANLMENELQCSICNEIFIEATSLNCRHTFCFYCICLWRSKKNDCPVCRSLIVSQNRILALDNFIGKMSERFPDEIRAKREELIAERNAVPDSLQREIEELLVAPESDDEESDSDDPTSSSSSQPSQPRNRLWFEGMVSPAMAMLLTRSNNCPRTQEQLMHLVSTTSRENRPISRSPIAPRAAPVPPPTTPAPTPSSTTTMPPTPPPYFRQEP